MEKVKSYFRPLDWQKEPFRCTKPVVLLTGSAGGGKSKLACEKVHAFCMKYPGSMGIMLRKTRESITNSTVLFYQRQIVGNNPQVRHFPSRHRFEYSNGSIVAYGGMKDEAQREQIRSIGQDGALDIAFMEEANKFTNDDFNEVISRMRGKAAPWTQIILSTNPDAYTHWINQELILKKDDNERVGVFFSSAKDNTHNPEQYLSNLDSLTGILRRRLRDGIWCRAEGVVWDDWDDQVHCIDPFEIPDEWPRYRVWDFGYTNPTCVQWWAKDPINNRLYMYRELYHTKILTRDWVGRVLHLSKGEGIVTTICDWDAEDQAILRDAGIQTANADKRVLLGIQKVADRLRPQKDGKPSIYLFKYARLEKDHSLADKYLPTSTEEEVPGYIWKPSPDGSAVKEEPLKQNDHGCDNMRYMTMHVDKPRRGLFLW